MMACDREFAKAGSVARTQANINGARSVEQTRRLVGIVLAEYFWDIMDRFD
jgi:hypothetical protein